MRFALDENLPAAFARALDALARGDGDAVCHVTDLVGRSAADRDWIAALAAQPGGGVAISGDRRMLTRRHELRALREHRVTTFILAAGWSPLKFWDKAALLVARWPSIAATAKAVAPGSIFRVPHSRRGTLERVSV